MRKIKKNAYHKIILIYISNNSKSEKSKTKYLKISIQINDLGTTLAIKAITQPAGRLQVHKILFLKIQTKDVCFVSTGRPFQSLAPRNENDFWSFFDFLGILKSVAVVRRVQELQTNFLRTLFANPYNLQNVNFSCVIDLIGVELYTQVLLKKS